VPGLPLRGGGRIAVDPVRSLAYIITSFNNPRSPPNDSLRVYDYAKGVLLPAIPILVPKTPDGSFQWVVLDDVALSADRRFLYVTGYIYNALTGDYGSACRSASGPMAPCGWQRGPLLPPQTGLCFTCRCRPPARSACWPRLNCPKVFYVNFPIRTLTRSTRRVSPAIWRSDRTGPCM
jgi:hypothetical protein